MSSVNSSLISAGLSQGIDHFGSFHTKTLIVVPKPSKTNSLMLRTSAKQAFCRARACCFTPQHSSRGFSHRDFLGKVKEFENFRDESKLLHPFEAIRSSGKNRIRFFSPFSANGYASVAEAVSSSTDIEDESCFGEETSPEEEKREAGGRKRPRMVGISNAKYTLLRKKQVRIETEAWENAAKEYTELLKEMCRQKLAPNLPYMKSMFLGWFEPFRDAIEKEQEMCRLKMKKKKKNDAALAPFLLQLPAEIMAVITMHKLVGLLMSREENGTTRVVQASLVVGDAIEQESKIQRFLEKSRNKKNGYGKGNEGEADIMIEAMLKKKVTDLMKQQKLRAVRGIVNAHDCSKPWGNAIKAKVGSRLIELLIGTAYVQSPPAQRLADDPPDIRPAFIHTNRTSMKDAKKVAKRFGVIQCDPLVFEGLNKIASNMVIPYMPMLVPPVNWTGYDKGGYFFLPSYVMRTHGVRHQREAIKTAPRNQLKVIFEALDSLGNTRWRVNKRVLTVVERIWSNGGGTADLVDRNDVPLPEKPDTEDESLLKKWKRETRCVRKENGERYSQRCDIELKLTVARKVKDDDGFYYPHNVDFRGRAYPMHSYLNHLGADLCRGILEFAEGRPLGNSGLRWLKIHLANVYATGGVDKLSHEGRVAFTENHLDEIFDSADNPLEGKCWWLNAEDPFQCLAACINLADALRSSYPEKFISHIHIHQDGSCNGLQHYAALGRDKVGAAAVNLVAGDKPADVYSGIAERVLEIMNRDAQEDPEVNPDALQARLLVNQVDRKLVKQTVMTSVYGVTFIGARDQISKRLKERGADLNEEELFECSCYAAKTTLTALGEMFESARSIMSWLGECAKIIASQNEPVMWTTPLGLPVVQPYRKLGKQFVKTSLQILTIHRETEKISVRRQRTAFPPNFVHSLDGCHMMMTAVTCRKAGITFAGVHDSYWTHACNVDEMNRILREQFVELYQTPILENLLESFEQHFPELSFPRLPERGDFDLKDVLESPYFFN